MAKKLKKIIWESVNIPHSDLTAYLTIGNFQPGKFHILPCVDGSPYFVTVVFVVSEAQWEH